jgi:hypothetical protein
VARPHVVQHPAGGLTLAIQVSPGLTVYGIGAAKAMQPAEPKRPSQMTFGRMVLDARDVREARQVERGDWPAKG